jgi:hypothetical protein
VRHLAVDVIHLETDDRKPEPPAPEVPFYADSIEAQIAKELDALESLLN